MKTGYKTIRVELKDDVAVFVMNNPPVNQLSKHFVLELAEAFSEAYKDDGIKAIVLTGTKKKFHCRSRYHPDQRCKDQRPIFAEAQGKQSIS